MSAPGSTVDVVLLVQDALTTIVNMGNSLLVGQDALTTITNMGNSLLVGPDALTTLYHVHVNVSQETSFQFPAELCFSFRDSANQYSLDVS